MQLNQDLNLPDRVLNLEQNERFVLNGALVQNFGRGTEISILGEKAFVLRESEFLRPMATATPLDKTCALAQHILMGLIQRDQGEMRLVECVARLAATSKPELKAQIQIASEVLQAKGLLEGYTALMNVRRVEQINV